MRINCVTSFSMRATVSAVICALMAVGPVFAQETSEVPPFPNDLSVSGLQAAMTMSDDSTLGTGIIPDEVLNPAREYARETYKSGLGSRTGTFSVTMAPTNVRVNSNAGDAIGETQAEVAVAVFGDTVVVGWNDSRGFVAGNTVSSFGYSVDAGATFTDGGNVPLALSTDQAFGDPGVDTDEKGNWYYNQIYTRTAQQNIAVHHGRFVGSTLVWDSPVQASIGTSATGLLDKCLIGCDRVTGSIYVSYTRFTAIPQIEVVRSTTKGASWGAPIVLDNTTTPTSSKQAARPFCGPNGEVYVVWEKGANTINCPDGSGNVANTTGTIAFARSLNFGVTYDPFITIGTVNHSWTWSGPGDLRERANEFPDIGVDRSGGPNNGNIYVIWHESAPWTSNLSAGAVRNEAANTANNNPGGAELFNVGEDVNGSIATAADLDYWQFSAIQGQSLLFNLDPQGFNCGITGTSRGMRMRLFATQSPYPNPNGFPDSLLAASALGAFAQRIVWTAPKTGNYLVRLQASSGTVPFTYRLRVRSLAFGAPSPARDARDIVIVRSTNQGGSWSSEKLINDDPAGLENRRPFVCADGLGRVHAFWHDSRIPGLGSNATLTSVFGTTSYDGGVSWSPNYMVTDELSFFSFNTLAVPNIGDYNQVAATTGGLVHPAWSDQRLSTGDVRVPNSNAFSAGLGPETYTTAVSPPVIACPPDIVKGNDAGQCSAAVTYSVAVNGSPAPTLTCTPASGTAFTVGQTTVNCIASNGIGNPATCSFKVNVNDAEPPVLSCPSNVSIPGNIAGSCGATITTPTASATDNCPGVSVNGVRSDGKALGDPYPQGTTTIVWTATDAANHSVSCSQTITVTNPNPVVTITSPASGAVFAVGTTVNFTGTFTDNSGGTHTATWTADATTFAGTLDEGSGAITGSFTFASAGVYMISLTVTDGCGGTGSATTVGGLDAMVVIYDPNAGFVTGGGWINSPPGAYQPDLTLADKANFGFVSKYQKGANLPTGETEFQFKVADLNFHSTAYEWLVISGSKAQYQGTGTITGTGNYGFKLTATDGGTGNGVDKFRMKIWDKNAGDAIVYDNQFGSSDNSNPSTAIGGGSIIVHKNPAKEAADVTPRPTAFALAQNYPNPFNPTTIIEYALPVDARVRLTVYNTLGQVVANLVDEIQSAGFKQASFDATSLSSGLYIYRLDATSINDASRSFSKVEKMLLVR